MLSGALRSLLASSQIETKADGFALWRSRMVAFQGLRDWVPLFAFTVTFGISLRNLLGWLTTFCIWRIRSLLVFIRLVCRTAGMAGGHRQHEVRHCHIRLQLLDVWIQRFSSSNRCLQRTREQLTHFDEGLSIRPQQLRLRYPGKTWCWRLCVQCKQPVNPLAHHFIRCNTCKVQRQSPTLKGLVKAKV